MTSQLGIAVNWVGKQSNYKYRTMKYVYWVLHFCKTGSRGEYSVQVYLQTITLPKNAVLFIIIFSVDINLNEI